MQIFLFLSNVKLLTLLQEYFPVPTYFHMHYFQHILHESTIIISTIIKLFQVQDLVHRARHILEAFLRKTIETSKLSAFPSTAYSTSFNADQKTVNIAGKQFVTSPRTATVLSLVDNDPQQNSLNNFQGWKTLSLRESPFQVSAPLFRHPGKFEILPVRQDPSCHSTSSVSWSKSGTVRLVWSSSCRQASLAPFYAIHENIWSSGRQESAHKLETCIQSGKEE